MADKILPEQKNITTKDQSKTGETNKKMEVESLAEKLTQHNSQANPDIKEEHHKNEDEGMDLQNQESNSSGISPLVEDWTTIKDVDNSKNSIESSFDSSKGVDLALNVEAICKSTAMLCKLAVLKGFEFCHQHILEDKASPYKRCHFVYKSEKRCQNPAPKLGAVEQVSFCLHHEKQRERQQKKIRKSKERKTDSKKQKVVHGSSSGSRPSSKRSTPVHSSSEEEEYSFVTDSTQVEKIACTWLGNQASDADSTDSEDENPLNHAGAWTLEECVRICKEKMERLRTLYMLQYKRLNHNLKEDRRKMVTQYDMEPQTLLQVKPANVTGDPYTDFVEDMHLTNYQKLTGPELLAERQMKEKRNHGKKSDLARCHFSSDGSRCSSKVLPFSKYCFHHICSDQEQYLFEQCTSKDEKDNNKCIEPAFIFHETCQQHTCLEPSKTKRLMSGLEVAKKTREARKRKLEQSKQDVKKDDKREASHHNTRRASKNKEETPLHSPNLDFQPALNKLPESSNSNVLSAKEVFTTHKASLSIPKPEDLITKNMEGSASVIHNEGSEAPFSTTN
ncbi:KAT8 regulatory NSL complex subunit 2-like [Clytia hemisphaerica]|uniref:KAT8 regulatory NSL complex subunit 2-like n=1 Tax=Clytia hemisphaerica TaxID=252671 RepID=UPI0034D75055